MKKGEERMDDRERKPDNRNNKKAKLSVVCNLGRIVAAVTVALITGLDSLVKKKYDKKMDT